MPRRIRTPRRTAAAAALLVAAVLGGCTEGEAPVSSSDEQVATGGESTAGSDRATGDGQGADDAGSADGASAGKKPRSAKGVRADTGVSDEAAGVVTSVDLESPPEVDRLRITFSGPISGYTAKYVKRVTEDPSGQAIELEGGAALLVVLHQATLDNAFQAGGSIEHQAFAGSLDFEPRMLAIREVAVAGDFEATLSLGIGVTRKLPYDIAFDTDSDVLTIDIAKP